jgi:putative long chain acyl-CoA synthase
MAVAAVTLRAERPLQARALTNAMRELPADERPTVVQVIDELPVTTWFRPMTGPLRAAGLPSADERAFYLDAGGERYRPLTAAARTRLTAQAGSVSPE